MILWKFASISESIYSSSLSLLSHRPGRGWIDDACMAWFQEKVSFLSLHPPFILPLRPSLIPEILFSQRQSLSFHNQRTNSLGEEPGDISSQEAIDGYRNHQGSEYLRSERRHLEEGLGAQEWGRSREENLRSLVMNISSFIVLPKVIRGAWASDILENILFTLMKSHHFNC